MGTYMVLILDIYEKPNKRHKHHRSNNLSRPINILTLFARSGYSFQTIKTFQVQN
jgi:hypothetical protein